MSPHHNTTTMYKGVTGLIISSITLLLILAVIGSIVYVFPHDIKYIWRWHAIPHLFVYREVVEIHTDLEGVVESITIDGEEALLVVKGDDGTTESHRVPTEGILLSEGDLTFPDDTLATDTTWRTGILLRGLWITLKASVLAMMVGCFIGVLGGVAVHSVLPPLRWSMVVYLEVIHDIPLLWHILVWHFFIGSRINAVLEVSGFQSLPPLWFGILALAFYTGATITTCIRDEIRIMFPPSTQTELGHVIGFSHVMRTVVSVSPKLSEYFTTILKDSSLLSLVAINELTKVTRSAIAHTLQPFELMLTGAALYFVVVFTFSKVLGLWSLRIAKRYAR